MTPRVALLGLGLAVGCADDQEANALPPDCTRTEAVQLLARADVREFTIQPARDTTFLLLRDLDRVQSTYAGPGCGAEATLIADGAGMLPTRLALDPRDDEPTLVCDQDTFQGFRVDLTGQRAPELLLPYFSCLGFPTAYGSLFMSRWSLALHLFADFPDESTARMIWERASDVVVLDEWVVSQTGGELQTYEMATGEVASIPGGKVAGITGRGEHVLWYSYGQPATVTLVDLRTRGSAVLGIYDSEANDQYVPNFPYWAWGFDRTGQYVYHLQPGGSEAFDLAGEAATLPAPGVVIQLLEGGGVLSVTDDDGRLHFTRPHDTMATALDGTYDRELHDPRTREIDGHLEQVVDGELRRIDLDGSPVRTLASDVGRMYEWLDEHRVVTLTEDRTLMRIDVTTGEHATLAEHVSHFQADGEGLYFTHFESPDPADDGLWYLSAAALDASE